MSQMSHFLKNWLGRSLAFGGAVIVAVAVTGCNPPADTPDPAKPEVSEETPAEGEATPAEETPAEEAPVDAGATTEAPNAAPEETAEKDPLDTTEESAGVKLGEPEDPVSFK